MWRMRYSSERQESTGWAGKSITELEKEQYGLEKEISSPTFTIVNEYNTSIYPFYHFDVYRLADIDEFYAMGGEEYFENGICFIEWGEIIEEILPPDYIKITFQKDIQNEDYRTLQIETFGNKVLTI